MRTDNFHGHVESRPQRMWDCLKYFYEQHKTKPCFYIATDTVGSSKTAKSLFPGRVLSLDDLTERLAPMHVADAVTQVSKDDYDRNLIGVMTDWWMIGEGNLKVLTDRSSFGFTGMAHFVIVTI